ncbi:hypothetical protein B296_00040697, partial [Ensete ventricosum]
RCSISSRGRKSGRGRRRSAAEDDAQARVLYVPTGTSVPRGIGVSTQDTPLPVAPGALASVVLVVDFAVGVVVAARDAVSEVVAAIDVVVIAALTGDYGSGGAAFVVVPAT